MKQPKISVIIPVRNEAEKIEQCLKAVFSQTYKSPDFQYIFSAIQDRRTGIIRAKRRGVKIRILMDKGQAQGKYSVYQFLLDNDIETIQDRRSGYMHNKIAIIDGRILFTGSYNWSKSAEERNQENLLQFIDEEEIIKVYQERLDYLWEFNQPQEHELSEEKRDCELI